MRVDQRWRSTFDEYLRSTKVNVNDYVYVEDYVEDKLHAILQRQILRKENFYNWQTRRLIRHRLINAAEEAGLIWHSDEEWR